ncbi:MAG TPA: DUF4124 domain-containing protein [Rhodanobacteraceae bacterium]|nr:DUF4124 domain-containing protein [Rhodanobacteraceae bacterium]
MQPRTLFAALAVGLSIACTAGFASAQQVYKWKDSTGVVHFSQTPPTNGAHFTEMKLANGSDVPPRTAAPAANSSAAAEAGRDLPAPSQPAEQRTQPDTPSNRAKLCKQLGSNVSLLQGKAPVVVTGSDGKPQVMTSEAREQQLATTRAQQAQYCSGG